MPDQFRARLQHYRRQRRIFSAKVYLLMIIFLLVSFIQWIVFNEVIDMDFIFVDHYYVTLITLMIALLLVSFFVFIENLRFFIPLNWIICLLIVEAVIIGLTRVVGERSLNGIVYSFVFTIILMLLLILIGVFLPHDFTLDVVLLFVASVIFFIGSVFFALMHIISQTPHSMYIYIFFVAITVIMFTMYHAQTISGSRYAEMRLKDYLLASLIMYHDFVILYLLFLYLVHLFESDLPDGKPVYEFFGVHGIVRTTTEATSKSLVS